MHRPLIALLLIAAALVPSGCQRSLSATQVIVSGSTTILPIAEQAAESYHEEHPEVDVLVSGMGSSAGIEAVLSGTADIGTASRDLKPEEDGKGLVDTPIAFDGIAVIVNGENPVDNLTTEQLRGIFAGEITNWSEVGGEDLPIDIVNRDEASGTREAFKKIVMGEEASFDPGAVILPGTGQVREVVSRARGAIGYISVGFVAPRFTKSVVNAVSVDGIAATEETVASGEYPIARALHLFTKGEPTGQAKKFVDYLLSDEVQNGTVVEAGFIPVSARRGQ